MLLLTGFNDNRARSYAIMPTTFTAAYEKRFVPLEGENSDKERLRKWADGLNTDAVPQQFPVPLRHQ